MVFNRIKCLKFDGMSSGFRNAGAQPLTTRRVAGRDMAMVLELGCGTNGGNPDMESSSYHQQRVSLGECGYEFGLTGVP